MLIDKARMAIQKIDISDAGVMLEPDYGLKTAIRWVKAKFGIDIDLEEISSLHSNDDVIQLVIDKALEAKAKPKSVEAFLQLIYQQSR